MLVFMMPPKPILALTLVAAALILPQDVFGQPVAGRAMVIDGDTIDVAGTRIRLHGIDAPKDGQPCKDGKSRVFDCGPLATAVMAHGVATKDGTMVRTGLPANPA